MDGGVRMDLRNAGQVVATVKTFETLLPIHEARLLTYRHSLGWSAGLLLDLIVPALRNSIRRQVYQLSKLSTSSASPRR